MVNVSVPLEKMRGQPLSDGRFAGALALGAFAAGSFALGASGSGCCAMAERKRRETAKIKVRIVRGMIDTVSIAGPRTCMTTPTHL
jgi:hypothetical protein